MKQLLLIIPLLAILFGCTKEVEIEIPGHEDKVVIDGRIETGFPPIVLLSTSQEVYAPTNLDAFLSGFISGADITVSNGTTSVQLEEICTDNLPAGSEPIVAELLGISVEDLATIHFCGYTSFNPQIFGEVGKTYDLTVKVNGQTFTSLTKIMTPTAFNDLWWKPYGNGITDHGYVWASLSDAPGVFDAYMWEVKRINTDANGDPLDPNFVTPFSPVIDDEFFDGLTFDFFYDNPQAYGPSTPDELFGLYPQGDTIVIKFSKLDEDVYEFMEKKYMQLGTAGNPFATPTNIPSNITGGALGVWAGFSPIFDTLACQP